MRATLAAFTKNMDVTDLRWNAGEGFTPSRLRIELLSGLTVALALVPEAVAFAFVAGVHPLVGLYAAFLVGLITALFGGRPGMIPVRLAPWLLLWWLWSRSTVWNICLPLSF